MATYTQQQQQQHRRTAATCNFLLAMNNEPVCANAAAEKCFACICQFSMPSNILSIPFDNSRLKSCPLILTRQIAKQPKSRRSRQHPSSRVPQIGGDSGIPKQKGHLTCQRE